MQVYIDSDGVQQYTTGKLSIDIDTGEAALFVVWDYVAHGGEIDPAKVGGYLNSDLDWSQEAFDANEALKVTVAEAKEAAQVAMTKNLALLAMSAGVSEINYLQRWFAAATVHFLDGIAKGNITSVSKEQFMAVLVAQKDL